MNTSRSTLLRVTRFGDRRRSTLSWCRKTRISTCNAARDRNTTATAHHISLQRSRITTIINRFAATRHPYWVCDRDNGTPKLLILSLFREPKLRTFRMIAWNTGSNWYPNRALITRRFWFSRYWTGSPRCGPASLRSSLLYAEFYCSAPPQKYIGAAAVPRLTDATISRLLIHCLGF